MGKKIIGQIAVSTIVTALAAIAGVAMMVVAGDNTYKYCGFLIIFTTRYSI